MRGRLTTSRPSAGYPGAAADPVRGAAGCRISLRLHRSAGRGRGAHGTPAQRAPSHAAHEALRELLRDDALPSRPRDAATGRGREPLHTPAVALRRATSAGDARRRAAPARRHDRGDPGAPTARRISLGVREGRPWCTSAPRLPQLATVLTGHDPDACAAAVQQAEALLQRMAGGKLGARLLELSPHVLARELPVLAPPTSSAQAAGSGRRPSGSALEPSTCSTATPRPTSWWWPTTRPTR